MFSRVALSDDELSPATFSSFKSFLLMSGDFEGGEGVGGIGEVESEASTDGDVCKSGLLNSLPRLIQLLSLRSSRPVLPECALEADVW